MVVALYLSGVGEFLPFYAKIRWTRLPYVLMQSDWLITLNFDDHKILFSKIETVIVQ